MGRNYHISSLCRGRDVERGCISQASDLQRYGGASFGVAGAWALPSGLNVIRAAFIEDGTAGSAGGTAQDQVFGSQARITIPDGALTGPTTISIDVLQVPTEYSNSAGFSRSCFAIREHRSNPASDWTDRSPGYTLTIPLANPLTPLRVLYLLRLDPISGNLIPAQGVSTSFVTGLVDTNGQTATFTGIASFSTVVGLLSSGQKPGDLNGDGVVSCADVSIVRAAISKRIGQSGFNPVADINRDELVNISDLSYVLRQLRAGLSCQ